MVKKNRKLVLALLDEGLTQREVSKKSGVNESRLSLIKNGRLIPSKAEAEKIAKLLECDPSDLFKEIA